MKLKWIFDEYFGDYYRIHMFLVTSSCTWKCEGCQNKHLTQLETKDFPDEEIWGKYLHNIFTSAIVIGGLEPFDELQDVINFIKVGIYKTEPDTPNTPIIIYTGYEMDEVPLKDSGFIEVAEKYPGDIIVKFGRYIPNQPHIFNKDLGIYLASPNQYTVIF